MNLSIIALAGLVHDAFGSGGKFTAYTYENTLRVRIDYSPHGSSVYSNGFCVDIDSKPNHLAIKAAEAIKSIKEASKNEWKT